MDDSELHLLLMESLEEVEVDRELLRCSPVEKYIGQLEKYPRLASHKYVSPEVEQICHGIRAHKGVGGLEMYHKLLLATLISKAYNNAGLLRLPKGIRECYYRNFKRILTGIRTGSEGEGFYQHSVDGFQKDLAVCTLRMIPTGNIKIHASKLSLRFLVKGGVKQFVKGLIVIFKVGGVSPFYFGHLDSHDREAMAELHYEGLVVHYKRVAQLLEISREFRGILGAAWFYDPQIKTISPRLWYLREIVERNGGQFFYVGRSAHTMKDALLKSPTRRRLYWEGAYLPKSYLLIWPRRPLIEWAKSLSQGDSL